MRILTIAILIVLLVGFSYDVSAQKAGSCVNGAKNYCNQKSPDNCWCDKYCARYGDCCNDYQAVCVSTDTNLPALVVSASTVSISESGEAKSTITATTPDKASGTIMSFSSTIGSIKPGVCVTDTNGSCSANFTTSSKGKASITVSALGYKSGSVIVEIVRPTNVSSCGLLFGDGNTTKNIDYLLIVTDSPDESRRTQTARDYEEYLLNFDKIKEYKDIFNVWVLKDEARGLCWRLSVKPLNVDVDCDDYRIDELKKMCPNDITTVLHAVIGSIKGNYALGPVSGKIGSDYQVVNRLSISTKILFVHETSHAFGLDDQYSNGVTTNMQPTNSKNCDDSTCSKWLGAIPDVGCYRTCGFTNWYRSTNSCDLWIIPGFWCLRWGGDSVMEFPRKIEHYDPVERIYLDKTLKGWIAEHK